MLEYKIIRSKRKTAVLEITPEREVVFRCNYIFPESRIRRIISDNEEYILKKLSSIKSSKKYPELDNASVLKMKKELLAYIEMRTNYYADKFSFQYKSIKITKAKHRFGSCSADNSLCFSVYLYLYPDDLKDYVIVHELCHTKHHDHSKSFYNELSSIMPDYKSRESKLKNYDFDKR